MCRTVFSPSARRFKRKILRKEDFDMTGKILDEILAAESNADGIKKTASARAAQMISDAKLAGEALCREVRDRADAEKKRLDAESTRVSEEMLEKTRDEAKNKALIVCAAASANIPDAVNLIIGKVGRLWQ